MTEKITVESTPTNSFLTEHSDVLLDERVGEEAAQEVQGLFGEQTWEEREGRNKLRHVEGLGELQDITEVEYRKVRLEKVVLVGDWSSRETTLQQA